MRRMPTPGAFLALAISLVLATMGLGFAAWADQLSINGSIQTADMNARWVTNAEAPGSLACFDSDGSGGIGSVHAQRNPLDTSNMVFTITNGYPTYWARCFLMWVNDGDVTIRRTGLTIDGIDASAFPAGVLFDFNGGGNDLRIRYSNGDTGGLTAPGQSGIDEIFVEALETSDPNTTNTFTGLHTFEFGGPQVIRQAHRQPAVRPPKDAEHATCSFQSRMRIQSTHQCQLPRR